MSRPAAILKGQPGVATEPGLATVSSKPARIVLAALRVVLGFYFVWAFVDKTFGFGFATPAERAWINGGSPTTGYLSGVEGPFAGVFNAIAGAAWADWLFMAGLLGIGVALTLGIGMRVATISGAVLYLLMWTVALPPANNPVLDDHVLGAISMVVLLLTGAGATWGLGRTWSRTRLVRRQAWLR